MELKLFRVSPTNWLRFWLISAPAATTDHGNHGCPLLAVGCSLFAENEISLLSHTRFYWHSNWQLNFGSNNSSNNDDINAAIERQAGATATATPTLTTIDRRPTTTILSALKRCNYFMPDNNLILSMPQNVQAKTDETGTARRDSGGMGTVWVRWMVAKCKSLASLLFMLIRVSRHRRHHRHRRQVSLQQQINWLLKPCLIAISFVMQNKHFYIQLTSKYNIKLPTPFDRNSIRCL